MTDYTEIEQARAKAHAKHGGNSIEGIDAADPRWLSILVEEIGEVSHELTYDATGSLRAELIDVLAVASAWLDALDGRAPGTPSAARVLLEIVTRIDEARYVNDARYDEDTSSPWANTDVLELLAHLRQPYTEGGATEALTSSSQPTPSAEDRNAWDTAVQAKRAEQRAKGYTAKHDREHGVEHLLLWAQDYASRGRHLDAAALVEAAREVLLWQRNAKSDYDLIEDQLRESGLSTIRDVTPPKEGDRG